MRVCALVVPRFGFLFCFLFFFLESLLVLRVHASIARLLICGLLFGRLIFFMLSYTVSLLLLVCQPLVALASHQLLSSTYTLRQWVHVTPRPAALLVLLLMLPAM
ncbi:hypothetical protein TcYC6_0065440 [Trypanosoma cruzi]|uniref:Uncharacterized protein n=1 Tax=Trypanosoma cruzi (strain CL Brener) TaxID=353153 RepID=Q4DYF5_TRYCC|nr:hypothetical protein Tc00.1047053506321.30 [Trypanosoma cruzi]EAN97536.1 hypothetical protein Tc00.1047053506321.30 [Trypanosoma cruzi]KAF8290276.1 hypothetical protein TcYC6_0004980 [Trypanosoma cruzi]KAF8299436.1 hypothetical protein TcYC6_0065440 [Trypanosoma cruzi]|eukprot:XP_819387.1 hypothetical protein [Trypanosoma cruzi strain CL Brener]